MAHDFKKFPELTNNQMEIYYFESPHKQIFEGFLADVTRIVDGDTIRVNCDFRDFNFPVRLLNIDAPELDESGGLESKNWLKEQILGEEVYIIINPKNRVERWGRLLGGIIHAGIDINNSSLNSGHSISWKDREKIWL